MKSVAFSFFSRASVALFNFAIVVLTAHSLGSEGRGLISLLTLSLTFSLLMHQLIGGGPLVYFAQKTSLKSLIIPAYVWAVISSLVITSIVFAIGQLPEQFFIHAILLSIIQCWLVTNTTLLLSFEKIVEQNVNSFVQVFLLLAVFGILTISGYGKNINSYLTALYISLAGALLLSIFQVQKIKQKENPVEVGFNSLIKGLLKFGLVIQSTNMMQFLNYRLSYYLVNSFAGTAALGVFSTAMSVGESTWIFSRSLANVQYPKIVNHQDDAYKLQITIDYTKLSLIVTTGMMVCILMLPQFVFVKLFGAEFYQIKGLIAYAAPGLIAMAYTTLLTLFFGNSKKQYQFFASAAGLVVTVISGFILIPHWLETGGCITSSLSYLANSILLIGVFMTFSKMSFAKLLPQTEDLKGFLSKFRTTLKK